MSTAMSTWSFNSYSFTSRTHCNLYKCNCIHFFQYRRSHLSLYPHFWHIWCNKLRRPAVFRRIWMHTLQCRRSCREGGNNYSRVVLIGLWPKPWRLDLWFFALIRIATRLDVFFEKWSQLMVNCWFGARWFGFLESPKMKGIVRIVTWVYPDSNPKPPGPKPTIHIN